MHLQSSFQVASKQCRSYFLVNFSLQYYYYYSQGSVARYAGYDGILNNILIQIYYESFSERIENW